RGCNPNEPIPTTVTDGIITISPPAELPDIDLSDSEYDFGSVLIGGFADWSFTISNLGIDPLSVYNVLSSDPEFQVLSPAFPQTIQGSENINVDVRFTPLTEGQLSSTLTISSNDFDEGTVFVELSGTGVAPLPDIQLSFIYHQFGGVIPGNTDSRILTIFNTGSGNLTVNSIISDNPTVFSITNFTPGQIVPPDEFIQPTIEFSPPAIGLYEAMITIISDDPDEDTLTVVVQGQGVAEAAQMNLSADEHDFGGVIVGDTAEWTLHVYSLGNLTLIITGLETTNEVFSFDQSDFPIEIQSGHSYDLGVFFDPLEAEAYQGELRIHSNDDGNPITPVALSGSGLQQDIYIEEDSHDFGIIQVGQFDDWQFDIQNVGSVPLQIVYINMTNDDFDVIDPEQFPQDIPANSELSVTVRFEPSVEGPIQGQLQIFSDDPDELQVNIDLNGTGFIARPIFNISASEHNFGLIETDDVSQWEFQIWNTGIADLQIESITSDLPEIFSISYLDYPVLIPTGAIPLAVTVQFSPQNPGIYNGSLTIVHNDEDLSPYFVNLSGEGVLPPSGLVVYIDDASSAAGIDGVPVRISMANNEIVASLQLTVEVPEEALTIDNISTINNGNLFDIFSFNDQGNGIFTITLDEGSIFPDS
ncbi:MAG: choice-of-anchor D domain-containing protein, partial [Planctomycetes bacterium]|nr:choice-of-anchor D domain-containing protein [Planctomycetota bacterium]